MCLGVSDDPIFDSTISLLGGIDNVAECRNNLFQLRIGIGGILPYLIGLRSQIHIVVVFVIQTAAFLIIHILQVLLISLEENLVTAHDIGILIDTGIQTGTQTNDVFNTFCREEGIAEDFF